MTTLTIPQAYNLLRQAGFSPAAAVQMTAIGLAESGLRTDAVGDVGLQNHTWGPSVGAWQERTLRSATGSGGARDISRLTGNPAAQAAAAYETSGGGRNFRPWTTYVNGSAAAQLARVYAALGIPHGGPAPDSVPADPIPSGGSSTSGGAVTASPASLLTGDWASSAERLAVVAVGLLAAGALVVIGLTRGLPLPTPPIGKALEAL